MSVDPSAVFSLRLASCHHSRTVSTLELCIWHVYLKQIKLFCTKLVWLPVLAAMFPKSTLLCSASPFSFHTCHALSLAKRQVTLSPTYNIRRQSLQCKTNHICCPQNCSLVCWRIPLGKPKDWKQSNCRPTFNQNLDLGKTFCCKKGRLASCVQTFCYYSGHQLIDLWHILCQSTNNREITTQIHHGRLMLNFASTCFLSVLSDLVVIFFQRNRRH